MDECDRSGCRGCVRRNLPVAGVRDLTHLEGLRYIAFDVLGHHVERLLPDVVYLWFVALLLLSSKGKSRGLGWAVMLIVVGLEIVTVASLLLGFAMPKEIVLLPFVWLLFESAESNRGEPSLRGMTASPPLRTRDAH